MTKSKNLNDIIAFHARASEASKSGISMKEFAKQEGTLANNIQARLYEAIIAGLPAVHFQDPNSLVRATTLTDDSVTQITLYTGRAKNPYLTLKVPTHIVEKAGVEGDNIEWKFQRGKIIGKKIGSSDSTHQNEEYHSE